MRALTIVNTVLILGLGSAFYFLQQINGDKTAFVHNRNIFEGFKGTKELQEKLKKLNQQNEKIADSLGNLHDLKRLPTDVYQEQIDRLRYQQEQMGAQFDAEVWAYINKGIEEYGKQNGYDFIFGASGNGSLMYAGANKNITKEVINYLNLKYDPTIK